MQHLRDAATARANQAIVHDFPRTMFVLMRAFWLLCWVLYRQARGHFHAFGFLALAAAIPVRLVAGQAGAAIGMLAIFAYHNASLQRAFGGSRFETAWKGTLIPTVYLVAVLAMVFVIGLPVTRM